MIHKSLILAFMMLMVIPTAQSLTVTISMKDNGDQTYFVESSKNMEVESTAHSDFENLNIEHSTKYRSLGEKSSYNIHLEGVKDGRKNYEINGVVRANSSVEGNAKLSANPTKAELENNFEGDGKIEAYASSTKSDATVYSKDPCDPPMVVGEENKEMAKVSLDAEGRVKATQRAKYDGLANVQSKTTIEGKYGYSAAWASKNPDDNGKWLKITGGWWNYKMWIKGNESASTWAKFTDEGLLKTEFYASVGDTAKSYGNAFVKDTSIIDYGNAHYGRTDGDIYVTAESIWCGNLDAFVASHSLNAHASATFAGIENGELNSNLNAETGSFANADFTSESFASHNELYSASEGSEYKYKWYWDDWSTNPDSPRNYKKNVDAEGFGYSDGSVTEADLNPSGRH